MLRESDDILSEDALHQQRYHCCIAGALQATAVDTNSMNDE
jgi:hypothetical protein